MGEEPVRRCDECGRAITSANCARGLCTACYARWRRNQPDRCRCCGGPLGDEPVRGRSHERCLANRRMRWGQYRIRVFAGYGGRCACCSEDDPRFLTIDHINGDGKIHRESLGGGSGRIWLDILKRGFPSEFQVLCYNCNSGRSINGGICPHADPLETSPWLKGQHREVERWIERRATHGKRQAP